MRKLNADAKTTCSPSISRYIDGAVRAGKARIKSSNSVIAKAGSIGSRPYQRDRTRGSGRGNSDGYGACTAAELKSIIAVASCRV